MSRKNHIEVNLDVDVDVFTTGTATDLLDAIIEYLLYQRNQIPFVFRTFKYLVSRWKPVDEDAEYSDYILEKHRNSARNTLSNYNDVSKALREAIKQTNLSSIRLLFGSTTSTPKEIYTINLPEISRVHSPENHKAFLEPALRKLLISLVTSEALSHVFSSQISTTNMYVEIEVEGKNLEESDYFIEKEFDYPPSSKCTSVTLNIKHEPSKDASLNCCKELVVFKDLADLSLNEAAKELPTDEQKSSQRTWMEVNCFVRGFKYILVDLAVNCKSLVVNVGTNFESQLYRLTSNLWSIIFQKNNYDKFSDGDEAFSGTVRSYMVIFLGKSAIDTVFRI